MADSRRPDEEDSKWPTMAAAIVAIVLGLIPALIAAGPAWRLRGRVRPVEAAIAAIAPVVLLVVNFGPWVKGYLSWLWQVAFGSEPFAERIQAGPWPAVLSLAAIVCCAYLMVTGTPLAVRLRLPGESVRAADASLLPDEKDRRKIERSKRSIDDSRRTVFGKRGSRGAADANTVLAIGVNREDQKVGIPVGALSMHMCVFGGSGSGKTELLKRLVGSSGDAHMDITFIDPKHELAPGGMYEFLRDYASHHSLPFQAMYMKDECPFYLDVLDGLSRDEAREMVIAPMTFEAAHYENMSKNFLNQILEIYYDAHDLDPAQFPLPTMRELGLMFQGGTWEKDTKSRRAVLLVHRNEQRTAAGERPLGPKEWDAEFALVTSSEAALKSTIIGFGNRIMATFGTRVGQTLLTPSKDRQRLDVNARGITYIGIDVTGQPDVSRMIATVVLQRYANLVARRNAGESGTDRQRLLIVDEAGDNVLNLGIAENLLQRARSAKIAVVLATQAATSWKTKTKNYFDSFTQNCNVKVVMRQATPESAELCAAMFGEREVPKIGKELDEYGRVVETTRVRETYDPWLHPSEVMELATGEAVMRVGMPSIRDYVKVERRAALDSRRLPR